MIPIHSLVKEGGKAGLLMRPKESKGLVMTRSLSMSTLGSMPLN